MLKHMMDNNLICDQQHGFVPGRSCITQLIDILDKWTKILDDGDPVDVVYTDFQKAFDRVPHQRLLSKVKAYGFDGEVFGWLCDFLSDRKQRVNRNGEKSDWVEVTSGIPQGSVLGPLLFVIFINDMPALIRCLMRMFADDAKMFYPVPTTRECEIVQADLYVLSDWSAIWQLPFNCLKCKVMHIGYNNLEHEYHMTKVDRTQHVLAKTTTEKDLGILVDNQLKFHDHTSKACNRANQIVGLIRRTFVHLDGEMLKKLYTSLVRPIVEYGNCVRSPRFKTDMNNLEKVQRRMTKLIFEIKDFTYQQRLEYLKLPSLNYRRQRGDMIQVYKIINGIDRLPAEDLFKRNTTGRTRGHTYKLQKENCQLDVRK